MKLTLKQLKSIVQETIVQERIESGFKPCPDCFTPSPPRRRGPDGKSYKYVCTECDHEWSIPMFESKQIIKEEVGSYEASMLVDQAEKLVSSIEEVIKNAEVDVHSSEDPDLGWMLKSHLQTAKKLSSDLKSTFGLDIGELGGDPDEDHELLTRDPRRGPRR